MNWSRVRVPVIAMSAAAAFSLISLVVVKYGLRTPSGPEIRTVPVALATNRYNEREFSFAPRPEPRPVPGLRFVDGEGRALTIADFRGRLVLLNIWATWCGPCRREMPTLDRLQAKFGGPDFEVVALSIDQKGLPVVQAFYQELGLEALGIYVDESARAPRDLNVIGIPTTLLIDQKGREIGRVVGPAEWDGPAVLKLVGRYLKPPLAGDGRSGEFSKPAAAPGATKP